ncbi:MAG: S4 domain-containing protein, partial [Chloroflexota bacterium]
MATQTIIKFLTASGAGSRRKMTDAIKAGRVAVNGQTVESFTQPVNAARDKVTMDGKRIAQESQGMLYLLLNKPKGIVSTTS